MVSFFSNAFFLFLRKHINLTRIGTDCIVCVGVLTFKDHGWQQEKYVWGLGGDMNLLKANDGSLFMGGQEWYL